MDMNLSGLAEAQAVDFVYGEAGNDSKKIAPGNIKIGPLEVSFAGSWIYDYPFIVADNDKRAFQDGDAGSPVAGTGVWIAEFTYTEPAWFPSTLASPLTSLAFPNLVGVGNFSPNLLESLTTLDLGNLATVIGNFTPNIMNALTTLTLTNLRMVATSFSPANMSALTTLSAPALVTTGSVSISTLGGLQVFDLPLLKSIGSSLSLSSFPALTSFSLPSLEYVGSFLQISSMTALTAFDCSALRVLGNTALFSDLGFITSLDFSNLVYISSGLTISLCSSLTSLDVSSLVTCSAFTISNGTPNLATITMPPPGTLKTASNFIISSCALTQQSVDDILVALAALDGTNGTTVYTGRTVTLTGTSSLPSATGLAAIAMLVARGCTVTTN